jgi:kynureninase
MTAPATTAHDPELWRSRFPILEQSTYLVNHSLGAMPVAVYDKLRSFADSWAVLGVRAWSEAGWWESPVTVGNVLARIINAPEGTVAMHQNVSVIEGIIASALDFTGPRNKVVYTDQNFPTNMYVWEGFKKLGARIEVVASDDGVGVQLEKLLEAIDEQTLIVPISHVFFRT